MTLSFGGGALWVMWCVASREICLVRCVVVCAAVVERERERESAVCRCECRCAARPLSLSCDRVVGERSGGGVRRAIFDYSSGARAEGERESESCVL